MKIELQDLLKRIENNNHLSKDFWGKFNAFERQMLYGTLKITLVKMLKELDKK